MFDRVRNAATAAIHAQDELLAAWRAFDAESGSVPLNQSDVALLHQLVFRKIYPANAFNELARQDRDAAIVALISRYLGKQVDPDRGFGGLVFDLSTMLSDMVEIRGEQSIRRLIDHPEFNREMLSDPRFIESLCYALEIEEVDYSNWLAGQL